jgi:hypothetical protein
VQPEKNLARVVGMGRRRRAGWVYALAAAFLVGVTAVSVRLWLPAAVASAAAAVAAVVAGVWTARAAVSAGEGREDRLAGAARMVRLNGRGELPLVRDLDDPVSLGVHPAAAVDDRKRAPAFIARDIAARLHEALLRDRFVVLVGESAAGKSRAAYEAMRVLLPDRRIVEPLGRQAVPAALAAAVGVPGCVLWLDDLERFLGEGGLTGADVANLLAARGSARFIIATLRAGEQAKFSGRIGPGPGGVSSEALRHGREVLHLAASVSVPRPWSAAELARAAEHATDPRIEGALDQSGRFGIAEYLAAAPQLLADWRNGWAPGTHPRGAALVLAAVDARRAGVHRPLPAVLLGQMHEPYLRDRGGTLLRPESMDAALDWATTALHGTSSLLVPSDSGTFLPFDYLIDSITREQIPAEALTVLLATASPGEAWDIGQAAWQWGHLDQAEAAFALAQAGDPKAFGMRYYVILDRDGQQPALAFARQVLAEREHALGPDHPDTLEAQAMLIWVQAEHDDDQASARQALQALTDLRADVIRVHGPAARQTSKRGAASRYGPATPATRPAQPTCSRPWHHIASGYSATITA